MCIDCFVTKEMYVKLYTLLCWTRDNWFTRMYTIKLTSEFWMNEIIRNLSNYLINTDLDL